MYLFALLTSYICIPNLSSQDANSHMPKTKVSLVTSQKWWLEIFASNQSQGDPNETLRPATVQKLETTISDGGTTSRNPLAVTNIHASGFCCWKMMMSSPWWWGTRWVCRLVFLFGLVKAGGRISEEGAQWLQPSILVFRLDVELFSVFQ